jgi:hypothetical protein
MDRRKGGREALDPMQPSVLAVIRSSAHGKITSATCQDGEH